MKQSSLNEQLKELKLVPVISTPSVEAGLRLAEILAANKLPVAEITFRSACAAETIAAIKAKFPDFLLLAGTVLNKQQAVSALEAGVSAIVSPGYTSRLAEYCKQNKISFFPGISTPSEAQSAFEDGLTVLKFFPAEMSGGVKMLSLFKEVYPQLCFMPTGGINKDNIGDYLRLDNVVCCGGTWLSPFQLMLNGEWKKIEQRIFAAVQIIRNL